MLSPVRLWEQKSPTFVTAQLPSNLQAMHGIDHHMLAAGALLVTPLLTELELAVCLEERASPEHCGGTMQRDDSIGVLFNGPDLDVAPCACTCKDTQLTELPVQEAWIAASMIKHEDDTPPDPVQQHDTHAHAVKDAAANITPSAEWASQAVNATTRAGKVGQEPGLACLERSSDKGAPASTHNHDVDQAIQLLVWIRAVRG